LFTNINWHHYPNLNLKNMGKFKKGFFLGGLLGAGLTWLNITKKGKEVRGQLLDHAALVYEETKEKLAASGALDKLTKAQFVKVVREVADKYAVKNEIVNKFKDMIVKLVSAQYENIRK